MSIREEFQVHLINPEGIAAAEAIALALSEALDKVDAIVPAGRERSLFVTNMQQAAFWAKRAIAIEPGYQLQFEPCQACQARGHLFADGGMKVDCARCKGTGRQVAKNG